MNHNFDNTGAPITDAEATENLEKWGSQQDGSSMLVCSAEPAAALIHFPAAFPGLGHKMYSSISLSRRWKLMSGFAAQRNTVLQLFSTLPLWDLEAKTAC